MHKNISGYSAYLRENIASNSITFPFPLDAAHSFIFSAYFSHSSFPISPLPLQLGSPVCCVCMCLRVPLAPHSRNLIKIILFSNRIEFLWRQRAFLYFVIRLLLPLQHQHAAPPWHTFCVCWPSCRIIVQLRLGWFLFTANINFFFSAMLLPSFPCTLTHVRALQSLGDAFSTLNCSTRSTLTLSCPIAFLVSSS